MLPNTNKTYNCELCDYTCSNKTNFDKHLATRKHNNTDKCLQKNEYSCSCGKIYKHRQSLSTHKKTCNPVTPTNEIVILTNLVKELLKNNSELQQQTNNFQKQLLEVCKNGNNTIVTNNSVTNTNNNQKFNINVFLNEQCKDAMNLSDFIKNIDVSREDLENNAQLGFVGGISKIFLDNLRQLSVNKRPIHCTDLKRETMYIKDDDKWTKEIGPAKLNTVIQTITQKSTRTLLDWKKENPDYNDNDSEFSTRCIVIQRNSMAGHDRDTYYPKVIHAIAREVVVNK
jgi:hypothetical protein